MNSARELWRVQGALYGKPWAIDPEYHRRICAIVDSHVKGAAAPFAVDDLEETRTPSGSLTIDGIAYINIQGPIFQKANLLDKMCGAVGLQDIEDQLETAARSADVEGVMLVIDSPGGAVTMVPEVAAKIRDFPKPIVSYVEGDCASAAYWLACSQPIYALGSGSVGSIGVYLTIYDQSAAYEMNGIKTIQVTTGPVKGMGVPGTEVTEDQIAFLRDEVVEPTAKQFFKAVTDARGVGDDLMDGRFWDGHTAEAIGLIDAVGTFDDALDELYELINQTTGE